MANKIIKSGFVLACALGSTSIFMAPTAANAQCGWVASVVRSEHNTTRARIRAEHERTRDAIINAIEVQTDELKTKLDEVTERLIETLTLAAKEASSHTDKHIEAQRRFADAQEMNATDRMRQDVRATAESGRFDPNPFSCSLLDIFESNRGSATPIAADAITQRAVARLEGDDADVSAGGVRVVKSVVDARDQYDGFNGSSNATTDWSLILQNPTLDLANSDMTAVMGWIVSNSVDPIPERAMTPEELATPEGMARAAEAQRRLARQRSAIETINMSINMRSPALNDQAGTFAGMASDSAYNRPVPNVISELQQLDIRTVYHYAPGPNRINGTGGQQNGLIHMNEKGWLQEVHTIMAINARINYMRLELENRNAVVNALILASLNQN